MKKVVIAVVSFLTLVSAPAWADVSNEFAVGLSGGSTEDYQYKDNLTGTTTDIEDVTETNSTVGLMYTRFLSPLREDGSSIELRRFHQHPSAFSVLLVGYGGKMEDKSNPFIVYESESSLSYIGLNGEFYFPTDTGITLGIISGSGEYKDKINGTDNINADLESKIYTAGLKQYLFNSLALWIEYSNQEADFEFGGSFSGYTATAEEKRLTGRAKLIIADTVGLLAEYGAGESETSSNIPSSTSTKYDTTDATGELQLYAGRGFSIRLGANVSTEKEKDMWPGAKSETTETKTYISPKFWFSEGFGIELLAYSTKVEENNSGNVYDVTFSHTESGGEVNLSLRF